MLKGCARDQHFGLCLSRRLGQPARAGGERRGKLLPPPPGSHEDSISLGLPPQQTCCGPQAGPRRACPSRPARRWPAPVTRPLGSLSEKSPLACCCDTKNPSCCSTGKWGSQHSYKAMGGPGGRPHLCLTPEPTGVDSGGFTTVQIAFILSFLFELFLQIFLASVKMYCVCVCVLGLGFSLFWKREKPGESAGG